IAAMGRLPDRAGVRLRQCRCYARRWRRLGAARDASAAWNRAWPFPRQTSRRLPRHLARGEAAPRATAGGRVVPPYLWRGAYLWRRVHHEPVHRAAGISNIAIVAGCCEGRRARRLTPVGGCRRTGPAARAARCTAYFGTAGFSSRGGLITISLSADGGGGCS